VTPGSADDDSDAASLDDTTSDAATSDAAALIGRLPDMGLSRTSWAVFLVGFLLTSASLSSGFVWAYQGLTWPVYLAAFTAWTGYLVAHRGATGVFLDGDPADPGRGPHPRRPARDVDEGVIPAATWRRLGILCGVVTLVAGMVIGVVFIRQEHHLLTNVGGVLFLGGYVIAHYAETDLLL